MSLHEFKYKICGRKDLLSIISNETYFTTLKLEEGI